MLNSETRKGSPMTMLGSEARQTRWPVLTYTRSISKWYALAVGHAKVQAQLLMLKPERQRLEVDENVDQGFFGEPVFNDAVADQGGPDTRLEDDVHAT
jgi:hypothetical protein